MVAALRLAAHPDAHVGVALLRAAEVGGHQVAAACLYDAGGVALGEVGLTIQKFVGHNLRTALRQRFVQIVCARCQFAPLTVRQTEGGCRVGGYLHVPRQPSVVFLPPAHDSAVDAVVGRLDVVYFIHAEVGGKQDVFVSGGSALYAAEVFVKPRQQIAEQHHMVARVHPRAGGVAVPQFPDGGGSVFGHVAPRRIFLVGGELPGDVGAPHVGKGVHQPSYADDSARQGAVVLRDEVGDDVLHHLAAHVVVIGQPEGVGQQVGGHGVVAVERAVGVEQVARHGARRLFLGEEFAVESGVGVGILIRKIARIVVERLLACPPLHQLAQTCVIGGGYQGAVGDAGYQSAFAILVFEVSQPAFHVGVVLVHGFMVAILPLQHIQGEGQCGRPRHVVGVVIPESGCHIGDAPVFTLCFNDVAYPFGIECFIVEEESLAIAASRAVAQPRLALVALRTIHGHTLVIAQHSPHGILIHLVQRGVAALECACRGHGVAHHLAGEVGHGSVAHATDLCITETVVNEGGMPPLSALLAVGIVAVGALCVAEIFHPEMSGAVYALGIAHDDGVALVQLS